MKIINKNELYLIQCKAFDDCLYVIYICYILFTLINKSTIIKTAIIKITIIKSTIIKTTINKSTIKIVQFNCRI